MRIFSHVLSARHFLPKIFAAITKAITRHGAAETGLAAFLEGSFMCDRISDVVSKASANGPGVSIARFDHPADSA